MKSDSVPPVRIYATFTISPVALSIPQDAGLLFLKIETSPSALSASITSILFCESSEMLCSELEISERFICIGY